MNVKSLNNNNLRIIEHHVNRCIYLIFISFFLLGGGYIYAEDLLDVFRTPIFDRNIFISIISLENVLNIVVLCTAVLIGIPLIIVLKVLSKEGKIVLQKDRLIITFWKKEKEIFLSEIRDIFVCYHRYRVKGGGIRVDYSLVVWTKDGKKIEKKLTEKDASRCKRLVREIVECDENHNSVSVYEWIHSG